MGAEGFEIREATRWQRGVISHDPNQTEYQYVQDEVAIVAASDSN